MQSTAQVTSSTSPRVVLDLAARTMAFAGLTLVGASFGFFYAWVCSTMWGLDTAPPEVAIAAMQAMNASVRNATFALSFFGTGPVLLIAAALAWLNGWRPAAAAFSGAGAIYILGGMILTMSFNVPMNEELALVDPSTPEAAAIWAEYSPGWQFWNQTRTVICGVALLLTGWGLTRMRAAD